ncbi:MAG: 1-hydroxycarotenoid 3,4-desaturase CrtD [Bacteroidota bacterium]
MPKSLIIGSGIAGIATAIRLRQKGHEVEVFEANSYPGGKLTSFTIDKFRFDAGPSLFTLPHLVTELFELFDENPKDYFAYHKMKTICNYFWEDGTRFSMPSDRKKQIEGLHATFNESKSKIERYLEKSKLKYERTAPIYLEKSLHKPSTWLSKHVFRALGEIQKYDVFSTLNDVNQKTFTNDKLIQLFNRFATYNGSSPYRTPGIMSMIPHLEMDIGAFFPKGGMESITNALVDLAKRHGVKFRYNNYVERVVHKKSTATGIITNGEYIEGNYVVTNMDVFSAYSKLLKDLKAPKKVLKQERSSSALIFYWGINKQFPELDLHNILFSDRYKEEFEYIFDKKIITDDPTVYINISSKENASDAPKNTENWFVMINTPGDFGQEWEVLISDARKSIIQKINRMLNVDIEPLIVCEQILHPKLIEQKTNSHQGSLYGMASNNRYAAFLRHSNFSKQLNNLFFCGGSVHPGGGIPLCLNSAKIVSNLIA